MATALIIGASRGIGFEFARQYRQAGWRVIATARKSEDLRKLEAIGCTALMLDVTNLNDCVGLPAHLGDEKLDVAIFNAGVIGGRNSSLDAPEQAVFDNTMHTNVLAAMRILPILLPLADKAEGKLAVLSSKMGSISLRENSASWLYRASKAALNSVLKDISLNTEKSVCVAFHPGWVRTDMGGSNADLSVEQSVSGMRSTLAGLSRNADDNGSFFNFDGSKLNW
jgi:NAD(P)-dependent dehydrogenase (short-subunit alcohol dehydrogenase family)